VAKFERDGWLSSRGMGGYVREGWVAKFERDGWIRSRGMGG
jgi:hypothetical protein